MILIAVLATVWLGSHLLADPTEPDLEVIDFHVHERCAAVAVHDSKIYDDYANCLKPLRDLVRSPLLLHAVILSENYNIAFREGQRQESYYLDPRFKSLADQFVERFMQEFPRKTSGLCGVNLSWPDLIPNARRCLGYAGFLGFKLHLNGPSRFLASDRLKMLKLAETLKNRGGIILIHFADEERFNQNGDLTETQALLEVARQAPAVSFIIAHSGLNQAIGLNGLELIGQTYEGDKHLPRNIYVDTAIPETIFVSEARIIEAWRKFGMERVLYASDFPWILKDGDHALRAGIEKWALNPFLTQPEKKDILSGNGKRLLNKLGVL